MAKNKYPSRRQAKKQTNWFLIVSSVLIVVLLVVAGAYSLFGVHHTVQQTSGTSVTKSDKQTASATQSKDTKGLPDVSPKDWELLLVNRDNKSKELNPKIADVDGISVDSRIAKNVKEFLAPKYGFVLRFPEGKASSTGVDYEDWHFRYVGKKSAEYMAKHDLTLEEYLALLKEKTK